MSYINQILMNWKHNSTPMDSPPGLAQLLATSNLTSIQLEELDRVSQTLEEEEARGKDAF